MALETLKGVKEIGGFPVVVMDELREKYPEKFKKKYSEDLPKWREENKEWKKKYRQTEKYKIQRYARDAIYYGIKFGYIKRPENCEICMKECTPEGHHFDYSKPKEVQWICHVCHEQAHGKLKDKDD